MYSRIVFCTFLICIVGAVFAGIPPERGVDRTGFNLLGQSKISYAPYTVQLRNGTGDIVCAGTLISAQHVLTAAQCFEKYEPSELTVVAGATTKSETGVQRAIEKVFKHDTYDATTFYNDAAVLKLQSPMELSRRVVAVEVCSEPYITQMVYPIAHMHGWFKSEQDKMYYMMNTVYEKERCSLAWQDGSILTKYPDSSFCDENAERFPCRVVPGSAGLLNNEVCGIVIGGPGCDDHNLPGALTSVYEIRDFILNTVKATSG